MVSSNMIKKNNTHDFSQTQIIILLCLWFISFIPIYPDLVRKWVDSSDNSHGILVPFISMYLIWQKRHLLKTAELSGYRGGLVIIAVSMLLYLIGYAGSLDILSRLMLVFSLAGLVLFCLGKEIFKIIVFPIFFLFFMIPVPDTILLSVSFPLQLFATKISYFLIQLLSIPCLREGNILYFAQTQLEVAEACSGIRSIMAYIMLSILFAYFMDRGWWKKAIIILSAVPLALFANIARVTGTGILAHFFGGQVATGFLHEFSGMVVFALGFILLFGEFLLLNRDQSAQ
jgi:exosortase